MVTVGMNYKVRAGKEKTFEEAFAKVLAVMAGADGHVASHLYRDVSDGQSYLIVSEWDSKPGFAAFIRSDAFRKVTDWGREEILAERPSHSLYSKESL